MSEYALAWSRHKPHLVSGGSDGLAVMWSIEDHTTSLYRSTGGSTTKWPQCKSLDARRVFRGHEATIEDVAFHPTDASGEVFCSVGDDRSIIFWDGRVSEGSGGSGGGRRRGGAAAASSSSGMLHRILEAHSEDINCVDWSVHNHAAVVTGSSDGIIQQYDFRMLSSSMDQRDRRAIVASYSDGALGNITNIQWSPHDARYFASAGDDGTVTVWDTLSSDTAEPGGLPPALMFRHCGHRASIVDFDWNAESPWTIVSMSDDSQNPRLGGGTLQVWRITDLLYKSGPAWEAKLEAALEGGSKKSDSSMEPDKTVVKKEKDQPFIRPS